MCPSFTTREYVSAIRKNVLLLETMLPVWQNWQTLWKHVSVTNFSKVSSFCQSLRKVSCPVNALPNRDADDARLKLGSAFGQDLLRSLWSRSNLFKRQRKFSHGLATQRKSTPSFLMVWPTNVSQRKFSHGLANQRKST